MSLNYLVTVFNIKTISKDLKILKVLFLCLKIILPVIISYNRIIPL